MSEFLLALQTFPTVIFSGLLGLMLFYWVTVIIGGLDLHLFSPGAGHGLGHHDVGHDGHLAPGTHETSGLGEFLSLGKVPVTITVSCFVFLAWMLSMLAELTLRAPLSSVLPSVVFSLVLFPAVVVASLMATAYTVRPLRRLFELVTEHGGASLIGRIARVTSRGVDAKFGTAECEGSGGGILLNVVCREGVSLKRDHMVVVVEYDEARQVYLVTPFSHTPVDGGAALPLRADPVLPPPPPSALASPVSLERQHEPPQ